MDIQGRFNQIADGEGVWPDMKYGDVHPAIVSYAIGTTMKQMRAWAAYADHKHHKQFPGDEDE
jgi:hypothetical protein